MERKLKLCSGCQTMKVIWKAKTKEHGMLCKDCYNKPKVGYTFKEDKISYDANGVPYQKEVRIVDIKPSNQKPISKVSVKQLERLKEYKKVRDAYMKEHPICEAQLDHCTGKSTDLHHGRGRIGSLLTDVSNFHALCSYCHHVVETRPSMAKELGLSKNRLDNYKI